LRTKYQQRYHVLNKLLNHPDFIEGLSYSLLNLQIRPDRFGPLEEECDNGAYSREDYEETLRFISNYKVNIEILISIQEENKISKEAFVLFAFTELNMTTTELIDNSLKEICPRTNSLSGKCSSQEKKEIIDTILKCDVRNLDLEEVDPLQFSEIKLADIALLMIDAFGYAKSLEGLTYWKEFRYVNNKYQTKLISIQAIGSEPEPSFSSINI